MASTETIIETDFTNDRERIMNGHLKQIEKYPLMVFGLPRQAAFLWIVANTLGLAYGAGVIIDHVERGRLSRKHADILNYQQKKTGNGNPTSADGLSDVAVF